MPLKKLTKIFSKIPLTTLPTSLRALPATKKSRIILGTIVATVLIATISILTLVARAVSLSVTEDFNDPEQIASKVDMTICNGQVLLSEATWSTLTECNCNSISGWYWYETNGRGACWSKTLADTVSWNKGVGDDVDNPGAYTCASDVPALKDRMIAASAGQWYKLVSSVNSVTITSSHNGSAGYSSISALAISDCLDGTRDLCTGNGCLGADLAAVNASLATWALATGSKSALPYYASSTSVGNDFQNACEQHSSNDYPLACYGGLFYANRKTCNDGDTNYSWASAAYNTTYARILGYSSCSLVFLNSASGAGSTIGFRVVLRP